MFLLRPLKAPYAMSTAKLETRAYSLWKRHKTDSREYREIAQQLHLNTAELNARCWHINHAKTWKN